MNFKRMMVLGAMASALAFTGCQDRRADEVRPVDQTQGTGGSGNVDSTIPGSSNTMGGVRQDERPGTELGGSSGSSIDDTRGTGGSGMVNDQAAPAPLDQSGTLNDQKSPDSLDQSGTGGSGMIEDQGSTLDQSGVGGSGTTKSGKKGTTGAGDAGTPSDAGM
ncbi:hypothetical protein [Hyalangium versicolor]|uniref:hypothetical protein n=1 Tax=Hyalangium versicolor TaxID=2861190 RepID=UPI001CCF0771|nr:hypothetical protein [Hyalangium versicolor]